MKIKKYLLTGVKRGDKVRSWKMLVGSVVTKSLSDPENPSYEDLLEWAGGEFDPEKQI